MLAAVCISLGDVNSTSPAVSCTDLINSIVFCEYDDQSRLRNFADGAFFSEGISMHGMIRNPIGASFLQILYASSLLRTTWVKNPAGRASIFF